MRNEGQSIRVGNEDGVQSAFETGVDVGTKIVDRADEVFVPHQEVGNDESKENGADPSTDEAWELRVSTMNNLPTVRVASHTFHRLLRTEFDELSPPKRDPAYVGEDVVNDHQTHGHQEPDHAFEDVVHDEMRLHYDQVECHMGPSKLCKLESIIVLLQRRHKEDEACVGQSARIILRSNSLSLTHHIKHKADEAVMGRKRQQDLVNQDNMLEVVNDALPVQKVHGGPQEIPVQCFGEA